MQMIPLVCACTCFFCIDHHSNADSPSCINFLFYLPNYCSVDDGEAMVEEYLHRENTTHMGNGHVQGPAMGGLSWLFMWIFTIFLTCQCVTSAILAT